MSNAAIKISQTFEASDSLIFISQFLNKIIWSFIRIKARHLLGLSVIKLDEFLNLFYAGKLAKFCRCKWEFLYLFKMNFYMFYTENLQLQLGVFVIFRNEFLHVYMKLKKTTMQKFMFDIENRLCLF